MELGRNVKATVEGKKLLLEIDLSKDFGASQSGKTNIVASTGGGQSVDASGVKVNLSAWRAK